MSWRHIGNWAKHKPLTLRVADRLDRSRGRLRLLDHWHPPAPARRKPDLTGWEERALSAVWIGHATVLLRMEGMTILTDPVFSSRVGLGFGLVTGGPRRLVAPALSLRELPPVDLILLSHAHFDHLDRPTLVRLPKRTPVITSQHTRDLVRDLGFRNVTELRWGERTQVERLTVTAHAVKHWGARIFYDHHRGFNSYLLESEHYRVLYGGDTAYHDGFKSIGNVDLAILGIGAYDPYIQAHATPEQAWQMAEHVHAAAVLPIHHSTFRLSHEPIHEPIQRILAAAGSEAHRIVAREVGDAWTKG